jgi:hypothetical protein
VNVDGVDLLRELEAEPERVLWRWHLCRI